MANWYVWHAATGSGTGADWANAFTSLASMSTKAAGDVFFVAHDHNQVPGSALTVTSPGTETNPCRIYCVNRAGSVPPVHADLRTTAVVGTTGAFAVSLAGSVSECYGIVFNPGTGSITIGATSRSWRLVACAFALAGTSTQRINLGAAGALTILENCTVSFGQIAQGIVPVGRVIVRNTSVNFSSGTTLTALLLPGGGATNCLVEGVNLSASTAALVAVSAVSPSNIVFKDCKLGAGVTMPTSFIAAGGPEVVLIRCDSGDTNYRTEKHNYLGKQETEVTRIHTGGATDGTTPISWKITTGANSALVFESLPISVWNETVGLPVAVTVEGCWDSGVVPLNSDIWIDVYYLGTSGFPLGSEATSGRASRLVAGTNIPAGSGTWSGGGTKFAMSATFTPQEKGPLTITVKAAKVSSFFYIDPKPVIT